MIDNQVFSDLRVLDISSILAGPLVTSFFAELGAQVVKVENKRIGGDATRQWRLPQESESGVSAYYASANFGKDVMLLDLKDADDYARLIEEVKKADIIVSNYQEARATQLQISYEDLSAHNEKVIYAQLFAYEQGDPRPGYDLVMQAETGYMSMNGHADGAPAKMPVALIDVLAAHQMKEAILISLYQREKSGRGKLIHVSLYQSAISALVNQASNFLMAGHIPQRMGSLHPNIAPYGDAFQSKDGVWFILAVGSDAQFNKLGETLNSNLLLSSKFTTNKGRVEQRKELQEALNSEFQQLSYHEIHKLLRESNIPHCLINTMDQVFNTHLAQDMILERDIEGQTVKSVSQIAFKILPW